MVGIYYCESQDSSVFRSYGAYHRKYYLGKLVFGGSLAFLFHHLGYADLSPAHLHALLTEILNIRNYMPPVPPLEPVVRHELIQATDPKVAIKPLSDYIK